MADSLKSIAASGNFETHAVDLSNGDAVEEFVREVLNKHDNVDVLVNNAGMGPDSHPLEGNLFRGQ